MVPAIAGMIVITYNIPGVAREIKLPRDVYVDILAGAIRRWDDPRITAANPGISFPPHEIVIVAGQDAGGTTAAFTRHLDTVGPAWGARGMRVGNIIEWPTGTALVVGNEGVASKIPTTEGSIGYVEFWFAQSGLVTGPLATNSRSSSNYHVVALSWFCLLLWYPNSIIDCLCSVHVRSIVSKGHRCNREAPSTGRVSDGLSSTI